MELVGLSVGTLFGGTFFQLIPETSKIIGMGLGPSSLILLGIVFAFLIENLIHLKRTTHLSGHNFHMHNHCHSVAVNFSRRYTEKSNSEVIQDQSVQHEIDITDGMIKIKDQDSNQPDNL